jgi:hypothetical protein
VIDEKGETAPPPRGAPPRWALVGGLAGGAMLLTMIVLLVLLLNEITTSRQHIESQDAKISTLLELGEPVADEAVPLLGEARPAIRQAQDLIEPLIHARSGTELAGLLQRFPALETAIRRLAGEAIPVLEQTDPALIATSLGAARDLAVRLAEGDRLVRVIDQASATLSAIAGSDLVERAAKSAARIRKLLAVQRETRALQARSLAVQRRSLAVQRESLEHIRSIDEKTGGQLPPLP